VTEPEDITSVVARCRDAQQALAATPGWMLRRRTRLLREWQAEQERLDAALSRQRFVLADLLSPLREKIDGSGWF
jgi:hypothetical protein